MDVLRGGYDYTIRIRFDFDSTGVGLLIKGH